MVENVGGINPLKQSFSTKGIRLSDLRDNERLFNLFKKAGYDENSVIYSSDVDKLSLQFDADKNGKLSVKEAREMGLEGTRKEIKAAIKELENIKTSDLTAQDELLPEKAGENETNFYDKNGTLIRNIKVSQDGAKEETYFLNGDKSKYDKIISTSADGKTVVSTEYLDGDLTKPLHKEETRDGVKTTTDFDYNPQNGILNSKKTRTGNNEETIVYKNINGEAVPERIIEGYSSDSNSVKVIYNEFDSSGKRIGQTIQYTGAKIKDNIIEEHADISYSENGEETVTSSSITLTDGSKQYFKKLDGKLQRLDKDEEGNYFVTFKIPKGWSVEQAAESFGVSVEDLLKANTVETGKPLYKTNKKGVNYFYVDDKVKVSDPAKLPEGLEYLYGEDAKPDAETKIIPENDETEAPAKATTPNVQKPARKGVQKNESKTVDNKASVDNAKNRLKARNQWVQKTMSTGVTIKAFVNADGRVTQRLTYDKNKNLKRKEVISYNYKGNRDESSIYDNKGNLIERTKYCLDGKTPISYEYTSGNERYGIQYYPRTTLMSSKTVTRNGKTIVNEQYDKSGKLIKHS